MIYLFIAHKKEASLIFKHFTCKRDKRFKNPLYLHEKFYLCITHGGYVNALNAATELFQFHPPSPHDCVINFGICGAPAHYNIGEFITIDTLTCKEESVSLNSSSNKHILECVESAQSKALPTLVDMESFAIYTTAYPLFEPSNIYVYKIVSDHFEPSDITPQRIKEVLEKNTSIFLEKLQ